jgi:hypothetical protein
MNKRGGLVDILADNVIYLVLLALFLSVMIVFVARQRDSVSLWENYYASEIEKLIEMAEPGNEFEIDVHKATEIADSRGVAQNKIFDFADGEIYVKVSASGRTMQRYYNNVKISEWEIIPGIEDGVNKLRFKVEAAG